MSGVNQSGKRAPSAGSLVVVLMSPPYHSQYIMYKLTSQLPNGDFLGISIGDYRSWIENAPPADKPLLAKDGGVVRIKPGRIFEVLPDHAVPKEKIKYAPARHDWQLARWEEAKAKIVEARPDPLNRERKEND